MTAIGRGRFNQLIDDLWQAYWWLVELPVVETGNGGKEPDRIEQMYDEVDIRRHVYSYADAFDSKDLSRIMDHFLDDSVLTTNRGEFAGRTAIHEYYTPTTLLNRLSYHRVQNLVVRVTSPGEEGWVAAYFHAPFIGFPPSARSQYGRYFGRLEKRDGRWGFADWRISVDQNRDFPRIA